MNFLGGSCQTTVKNCGNKVFLTFDDGPNDSFTPLLLDFCETNSFKATFFLVAKHAKQYPNLALELTRAGHSIGNHSLDHTYGHFFRGTQHLKTWIQSAQSELTMLTKQTPVAFRSPAGVRTPELRQALKEQGIPLVHWNHRFFDTMFSLKERMMISAAARAKPGDIFLLHDIPRANPMAFISALEVLVRNLRENGLEPAPLTHSDIE